MSDAETWGIVLLDRASGAEQWVACEVTRDGDIVTARAHGYGHRSVEYAQPTVEGVGRLILQHDRSLALVCIATPAKYAAHMESVRRALVADEVERLRAEVANHEIASTHLRAAMTAASVIEACELPDAITDLRARLAEAEATIADLRHAGNRAAVAYAESLARCAESSYVRGAEAMREAAVQACVTQADEEANYYIALGCDFCEEAIRALPLPAEAAPQPTQSHEAPTTLDAPLTIADAAARERSAAAQRCNAMTREGVETNDD